MRVIAVEGIRLKALPRCLPLPLPPPLLLLMISSRAMSIIAGAAIGKTKTQKEGERATGKTGGEEV